MIATPSRPAQPEPFLRDCAWPRSLDVTYPRCDPGPDGLRLPADTRAAAAIPAGVRFVFLGEPTALEVEQRHEHGDMRLHLIAGRDLVPEKHLPDGLHPNDDGRQIMADVVGPVLAAAVV